MSPTRFLLPVLIASVAWSLGSPTTAPLRADEPAPFPSLGELNAEYGRRSCSYRTVFVAVSATLIESL